MTSIRLSWVLSFIFLLALEGFSQQMQLFATEPLPLEITFNKTVNLVFPFAIKSVDKGSRDVLVQKVRGIENILLVKAAKKDFQQTNLTVITSDGQLFSFNVDYADEPLQLNLILTGEHKSAPSAIFQRVSEADIEQTAQMILENRVPARKNALNITDHIGQARLTLQGIYTDQDIIFFRFQLANRSDLSYQIENFRFFIRDKKQAKRTAVQEKEIIPVLQKGDITRVEGQSYNIFVIALSKFTIPDKKFLSIRLTEKEGGRHLAIRVKNKTIVRARSVS